MKRLARRTTSLLFLSFISLQMPVPTTSHATDPATSKHGEEAGTVDWGRDLAKGLEAGRASGKPVFLLFQEIPGCAGCKQFGHDVLSNPEVVAVIQSEFVPVLIPNNRPGKDAEVLAKYNEPSWNYQVVRFLNAEGKDIIPRKDRVWDAGPLAERMIAALEAAKRPVPDALRKLAAGRK